MSLQDRICLVVGGVRGIGAVVTADLREAGATVVATSRRGGDHSVPLDVTERDSVQSVANGIERDYGQLDVLIYNPGIAGPTEPLDRVTEEEWAETMLVNVTGAFRVCRACIPLLKRSQSGRIILIASMTGRRPLLHRVPYATSKTALIGFTRSLALELGPFGITVNTISPGYVEGERIEAVMAAQARARGQDEQVIRFAFEAESPLRHLVSPHSVAYAVRFLADPRAGDITGTDLNVSAGVWMD